MAKPVSKNKTADGRNGAFFHFHSRNHFYYFRFHSHNHFYYFRFHLTIAFRYILFALAHFLSFSLSRDWFLYLHCLAIDFYISTVSQSFLSLPRNCFRWRKLKRFRQRKDQVAKRVTSDASSNLAPGVLRMFVKEAWSALNKMESKFTVCTKPPSQVT